MTLHYFADKNADTVLIQPVGDHDLPEIENEVAEIKKLTSVDFQLIAVKVDDWNRELSPWEAPAVFGNEGFGNGAEDTLAEILTLCSDKSKELLHWRIFSGRAFCLVGGVPNGEIFRRCGGFLRRCGFLILWGI